MKPKVPVNVLSKSEKTLEFLVDLRPNSKKSFWDPETPSDALNDVDSNSIEAFATVNLDSYNRVICG